MKFRSLIALFFLILGTTAAATAGDPGTAGDKEIPKILEQVNPVYPEEAKQKKLQGSVNLDALINEKGEVVELKETTDKKILEKLQQTERPDPSLVKAAMDAVKQWKYEPFKDEAGNFKPVRITVTIRFKLK